MQKANILLNILNNKSKQNKAFVFKRLYRHLFNPSMYLAAYAKIYAKEGNMTPGVDGETIDGFNIKMVEKLIQDLKYEKYYPKPVKRKYIPKKNGSKRPLGIPAVKDKLIQEVIRSILSAIYEPIFSNYSHGFRSNRSCHTILDQIRINGKGSIWAIEGDIQGFYDNVDHEILLQQIRNKINDERFCRLLKRFLDAGYIYAKEVKHSFSGIPQGSIISPVLSNIFLHKFDEYMENVCSRSYKGKNRRVNPKYGLWDSRLVRARKKRNHQQAKECLKQKRKVPYGCSFDENYVRVKYYRYADDWIVLIIGSKQLAKTIKQDIKQFLRNTLKLQLNEEKTLITNLRKSSARFLGYEIVTSNDNSKLIKNSLGVKYRAINGNIQFLVPQDVITKKLQPFTRNGKAIHHNARINMPVLDIIDQYASEMRGLYNYYALATDVSIKLGKFRYYHYYSLAKTLARKEKSTVKKIIDKYGIEVPLKRKLGTRKIIGAKYVVKSGEKTLTYFNESLKRQRKAPKANVKDHPYNIPRCQLIDRLNKNECELCKKTGSHYDFEVHHVRKLKDVKNRYRKRGKQAPQWLIRMAAMNRKTLIVCRPCHDQIHSRPKR